MNFPPIVDVYARGPLAPQLLRCLFSLERWDVPRLRVRFVVSASDPSMRQDTYGDVVTLAGNRLVVERTARQAPPPDYRIAIGWRQRLPLGTIVIHDSFLPYLRGHCPSITAIAHKARGAGLTAFLADDEIDHGPIISQIDATVDPNTTIGNLLDELRRRMPMIVIDIVRYMQRVIVPRPQSGEPTYSLWRHGRDQYIDWCNENCAVIRRKVRALGLPYGGARTLDSAGRTYVIDEVGKPVETPYTYNVEPGKISTLHGQKLVHMGARVALPILKSTPPLPNGRFRLLHPEAVI